MASVLSPGQIAAAGAVFPVTSLTFISLRVLCRRRQSASFGADDWLMVPAVFFTLAMCIATLVGVGNHSVGYWTPEYDALGTDIPYQVGWISQIFQVVALGCVKLSVIFFCRRIFVVGEKTRIFNVVSAVLACIVAAWTISFFFALVTVCGTHPTAYYGSRLQEQLYCFDTEKFQLAYAWSDMLTDVLVLLLPVPSIAMLKMTGKRKLAIGGVFALGLLALAASSARTALYMQFLELEFGGGPPDGIRDQDMLASNGIYWTVIETGVAIIAANLPVTYKVVGLKGLETLKSKLRSFTSRSSRESLYSPSPTSDDSSQRTGSGGKSVQQVHGGQRGRTEVTMGSTGPDIEAGRIHATDTIDVV